jgi:serine protease Do
MHRRLSLPALCVLGVLAAPWATFAAADASAADSPASSADVGKLYDRVGKSLVAVQYVWESELGRRELVGAGVVVGDDGLIMTSVSLFDLRIPDAQMKEFKILVPTQEHEPDEIDAVFQGRDERTNTAFVRPKSADAAKNWTVLKFEDAKVSVGDPILSIGLLPKSAAYKTYLTRGTAGANLRGEIPQVLVVGGNLAALGSPVFNADGQAIGLVNSQPEQMPFLNDPRSAITNLTNPPLFFVPSADILQSIKDPPKAGEVLKLPWLGVPSQAMAGLNKDVAESMGLKDQPAVELGDIIAGSPAAKAGLKAGNIVVKLNGKALERGDEPEELPGILARQVRRMKVGDEVTLSILTAKDEPLKEVKVKLEERPKGSNLAERYYAEDLGFSVREMVFMDTYIRKLSADASGVVVALIKPNGSAFAAKLQGNDLITEMNGHPVKNLAEFKEAYEKVRKDKPRDALVLVVLREGNTQTIRIEPPQ